MSSINSRLGHKLTPQCGGLSKATKVTILKRAKIDNRFVRGMKEFAIKRLVCVPTTWRCPLLFLCSTETFVVKTLQDTDKLELGTGA